jgi:hypothetical protein
MDHIETKTHGLDVAPTRHGRRAQSRSTAQQQPSDFEELQALVPNQELLKLK